MGDDELVEIDLGMQKVFDVELVIASLRDDGVELAFYPQRDTGEFGGLSPHRCRVLVRADDADRVRAEFVEAAML